MCRRTFGRAAPCANEASRGGSRRELRAYERLHRRKRRIQRGGVAAARLREIRPPATAPADLRRDRTYELAGLDARNEIFRYTRDEHDLRRAFHRGEHDDRGLQPILELIDRVAQRARVGAIDLRRDDLHALDVDRAGGEVRALTRSELVLEGADFLLHLANALERIAHFVAELFARTAHEPGHFLEQRLVLLDVFQRTIAGERLDAPHARCDAAFADDLEEPDIARARDVRAAAQLHREVADAQHAHVSLVFLTEQRHRT